jgi:hypothetical protein
MANPLMITVILQGNFNQKFDVQIERNSTVGDLKKKIEEVLAIPMKAITAPLC